MDVETNSYEDIQYTLLIQYYDGRRLNKSLWCMNFPKSYSSHCICMGMLIQFTSKERSQWYTGLKLHVYNAKNCKYKREPDAHKGKTPFQRHI